MRTSEARSVRRSSKYAAALLAAAALGLAGCASAPTVSEHTVTVVPDYPTYESAADLVASADIVAVVSVGSATNDVLLPDYGSNDPATNPNAGTSSAPDPREGAIPVTVFDTTVKSVVRGDVRPGQTLQVKQAGGTLDGVSYVIEGVKPLTSGSTVLLFLATFDDSPASVLGGDLGIFAKRDKDGWVSVANKNLIISKAEVDKYISTK